MRFTVFTMENTYGYTQEELNHLNRELYTQRYIQKVPRDPRDFEELQVEKDFIQGFIQDFDVKTNSDFSL